MNAKNLSCLSVLAVLAGSILLPVSAIAVATTFSIVGILAILSADYGREISPVHTEVRTIPFLAPGRPAAEVREAA